MNNDDEYLSSSDSNNNTYSTKKKIDRKGNSKPSIENDKISKTTMSI